MGQLGFDAASFGTAANNGQMIAEVSANHKSNEIFRSIGLTVTGRQPVGAGTKSANLIKLPSLFKKRA